MGSTTSSGRAISFPSPRILSTNPPDLAEPNELWIYFPEIGNHSGLPYTNAARGWWVQFDTKKDINSVRGLNGALAINFRPGQAAAMNLPQNAGSVLMGTGYRISTSNGMVTLIVPYSNVVTNE